MSKALRLVPAANAPRFFYRSILQRPTFKFPPKHTYIARRTFAAMTSSTVKLNSGYEMPLVGFGLWKVENNTADTVYNAIKNGYRLLDGACDYGNEKACGEGVARAIKDGLVKREDLFITSKLWQTFHEGHQVEPITRRQLADWGIDYFDLFLIHFPVALEYVDPSVRYPPGWSAPGEAPKWSKATTQETWTAMESLVEKGLAKSIGVANFQSQLLFDLTRYAKIIPASLQVEIHPYYQQEELVKMAKNEGIYVTAYSSFGPTGFIECNMDPADNAKSLMDHEVIKGIADKVGKTPAQVLLRWATQRGLAVIPKTYSEERMKANLDCLSWDIPAEGMDAIAKLEMNLKFNKPTNYFKADNLWIFG